VHGRTVNEAKDVIKPKEIKTVSQVDFEHAYTHPASYLRFERGMAAGK